MELNTEGKAKLTAGSAWRKWFAFTAFPLAAGTLGPLSTALNICALAEPWRLNPETGRFIKDSSWVLVINGLSIGFGTIANVSLGCLVTANDEGESPDENERVLPRKRHRSIRVISRLSNAHPQLILTTITTGYLAASLLTSIVVAATICYERSNEAIWTQAYFFASFSSGLYFLISCFLVFSAIEARDEDAESKSLSFHAALTPGPKHLNRPEVRGRSELGGIHTTRPTVGRWRWIFRIETHHQKLMGCTVALLMYMQVFAAVFSHIESWRYLDAFYWVDLTVLTVGFGDVRPVTSLGRGLLLLMAPLGFFFAGVVVYYVAKTVLEDGKSRMEEQLKTSKRKAALSHIGPYQDDVQARMRMFNLMRKIEYQARFRCQLISVGVSASVWAFLWLGGALIFQVCELSQHWSYLETVYFTQVSLLTIGYGDFKPKTNSGRSFFVLWSLLAVPTTTVLATSIINMAMESWRYKTRRKKPSSEKRFFHQQHSYKHRGTPGTPQGWQRSEKLIHHETPEKVHITAAAIKDVLYDHISDAKYRYNFVSWEWILYILDAIDEPPDEEPKHMHNIHEVWTPHKPWNWLDEDNAIASSDSETQWILEKLIHKLVGDLGTIRKENRRLEQ